MIEVLFAVAMVCGSPEPLPNDYVEGAIASGVLMDEIYGSHPYDLPTVASVDGTLSYRITVDPMYNSYGRCFYQQVKRILTDDRSWPNIREAESEEIPQVWILLTPPAVCGHPGPIISCASGYGGQGQIWMNYNRWMGGSSQTDDLLYDRAHVINHEIGHHLLGGQHASCAFDGPSVMVPTGRTSICEYQAWPNIQEKLASR